MACSFLAILVLGCRLCGIHLGHRRYLDDLLLEVCRVPNELKYLLAEGSGGEGRGDKLDIAAGMLHSTIPVVRRASW